MTSFGAYDIAVLTVIFTLNIISPVKGQCTVKSCESGDSASSIAAEIKQMFAEFHERLQAIDRRSQDQVQGIDGFLNTSFQQMKNQQDTVMTSLQAVDRRSQEQLQGMKNLNASFQQMKNQQDTVMRSLQAVDRRSHQQLQGMMNLNTSLQQMKMQQDNVLKSLEDIDQRLSELDITIKNETQNSWKLAIAVGIDLERGPVPPIINNWIVLMRRFNGSLNFNRSWIEYKNGFGDIGRGVFWLGNEKIHRLTNRFFYTLRIEVQLKANGVWYHADYSAFSLDSENNKYALRLSGFSGGNAGDSLTNTTVSSVVFLGGMNFTTWDNDNDRNVGNCASSYGGGWWHNDCYHACLTCQYTPQFVWYSLRHLTSDGVGRLQAARMMIRSN